MAEKPALVLGGGQTIPSIGLGVWRADPGVIHNLILESLRLGYRHFDCAGTTPVVCSLSAHGSLNYMAERFWFFCSPAVPNIDADYQNEKEVGTALSDGIAQGLVKREDLFITTKLWNSDHGHVREACEDSLKNLQLEYLDLYLVHFPIATRHTGVGTTDSVKGPDGVLDIDVTVSLESTWHDMEGLVSAGLVRHIGISNYDVFLTRDCLAYSKIKPAVNQIETHPYFQRNDLVKFCQKHGIVITAHTPLGGGAANTALFGSISPLDDSIIKGLAEKYKKSPAQIVLRWDVQRNVVVIPKTNNLERLKENLDIFDFELSPQDMDIIRKVDLRARSNQPAAFWGINLFD